MNTSRIMLAYPDCRLDTIDPTDIFQVDNLIRTLEDEAYALVRDGEFSAGNNLFMSIPVLYSIRQDLAEQVPSGIVH